MSVVFDANGIFLDRSSQQKDRLTEADATFSWGMFAYFRHATSETRDQHLQHQIPAPLLCTNSASPLQASWWSLMALTRWRLVGGRGGHRRHQDTEGVCVCVCVCKRCAKKTYENNIDRYIYIYLERENHESQKHVYKLLMETMCILNKRIASSRVIIFGETASLYHAGRTLLTRGAQNIDEDDKLLVSLSMFFRDITTCGWFDLLLVL